MVYEVSQNMGNRRASHCFHSWFRYPIVTGRSCFIWEWRKTNLESARLDIDRARASVELREKMNLMLTEIVKLDVNSPMRISKVADFNAAERNLALIEGRTAITYRFTRPAAPTGVRITE